MSANENNQNLNEDEYYDVNNVDEDLDALESELLDSKPTLRRNPSRSVRGQQHNVPSKSKKNKKNNNPNLPENLLRLDSNASTNSDKENEDDENLSEIFGDTVADIKNSMSHVDSKLNRMVEVMRKMNNRVTKLETRSRELVECVKTQQKEIVVLRNRCETNDRISRLNKVILNFAAIDTTDQNYRGKVRSILHDVLKLSPTITDHIFISQFGKSKNTVLLDLPSTAVKAAIFRSRADLRDNDNYKELSVNEFLSKKGSEIMKVARQMKKQKRIYTAFSMNGQVYVKLKSEDEKRLISNLDDLANLN